jgi:hypothetical protein
MDTRTKLETLVAATSFLLVGGAASALTSAAPLKGGAQSPSSASTDTKQKQESQQSKQETQQSPPKQQPAKALATGELARNAHQYYGQRVTMTAEVDDALNAHGFTLDSDQDYEGPDVLVINPAPQATQQLRDDERVTVTGTVRRFVRAELEREFSWFGETGQRWEVEYRERPVVIAESVRTATGRELVQSGAKTGSTATSSEAGSTAGGSASGMPAAGTGGGMSAADTEPPAGRGDPTIAAARSAGDAPGSISSTTAGNLAKNPQSYYGKRVSVTAEIEDAFGANAFTLDEDQLFAGPDVLVLFSGMREPVPEDRKVTVTGEVMRYVAGELDRDYDWFEPRAEWDVQFRERPVIVADSVKTQDGRELLTDAAERQKQ